MVTSPSIKTLNGLKPVVKANTYEGACAGSKNDDGEQDTL